MASVYILYTKGLDRYYTGSCLDIKNRLQQHKDNHFKRGFTHRSDDWELVLEIPNLGYKQARSIENHIKRMHSKQYIENLCTYPEMVEKLCSRYAGAGSSR